MSKEVCIQCTAFDNKGRGHFSREFNRDGYPLDECADEALLVFISMLAQADMTKCTVRITVDIALSENWYAEIQTTE